MAAVDFGYAQARVQARHGERLSEADWHALAAVGEFSAFLAAVRETPLKRLVRGISPRTDVHALEAQLRAELVEAIGEVARWVPQPWRDAVEWCAALPYLPLGRHVALTGAPPPALAGDWERWQGRIAPLAAHDDPLERWHAAWRARWPACPARSRRALERLARTVRTQRPALAAEMRRRVRADLLAPAAVFAHLVLEALDVERLRGELVPRLLFGGARA